MGEYLEKYSDVSEKQKMPAVSGDLPGEYIEGIGFSDYVSMETEPITSYEFSTDPQLLHAREKLKEALNEACAANIKLKVFENSMERMSS